MIKTVIFDIGNVLTKFRWKEFIHGFGFPENIEEKVGRATVRSSFWNELDRGVLAEDQLLAGFIQNEPSAEKEIRQVFSSLTGILEKLDYAVPWIQELKNKGYRVLVLSNISEKVIRDNPEAMGFLDAVDGGVLSYKEQLIKPDAEIYRCILEKYGLEAQECIFLDDTKRNIETAAELGFSVILFRSFEQAREELAQLGVR